ncbi:DUF2264 domain-containing protein [Scandinavium manionii]|uniref:DUF2264 domain-containing protein n=1 Tax=Scandinavium manionii TaxID=2926520 RepID=UPI00216522BA|nr:DUF2264 domain-containing protein [Scandinavium manionii]MCS2164571.1 DUF2264 domain-containing protein [Scandinavium manionii]
MQPQSITLDNPLRDRDDLLLFTQEMLSAVANYRNNQISGFDLANFTAHYGHERSHMEAFSRQLWAVAPMLAAGDIPEHFAFYIQGIKNGTNPDHPHYWGDPIAYDQRVVEMAAFGLLLAIASKPLLAHFNEQERLQLCQWLKRCEDQPIPDNNWHFFPVLVQVGFYHCGMPVNTQLIDDHFAAMEKYYLGEGWYSDGADRPRDYYIAMGFHFYGLIYATLMNESDPVRCKQLRERATQFASDFLYFFTDDGDAIPFGRSQTYRFAQVAFWSAVAWSGLDVFPPGVVKGIILRHLRWWLKQPIFDRDGVLSVGYSYPNLIMSEEYNAPGSPYWALKSMLILALGKESPFWQTPELPMPPRKSLHVIPVTHQILVNQHSANHLWMMTSGQFEFNRFANSEAKYCKFAYSARYGFTLERDRNGLGHASADSMLLFSEHDGYWRGRREYLAVSTLNGVIWSHWQPWKDVLIDTWLLVLGDWQIRVHQIQTQRELETVEGGFSLVNRPLPQCDNASGHSRITTATDISAIYCLNSVSRQGETVLTAPNSNILFPDRAIIPLLRGSLSVGTHLLITAVIAGEQPLGNISAVPAALSEGVHITFTLADKTKTISLK